MEREGRFRLDIWGDFCSERASAVAQAAQGSGGVTISEGFNSSVDVALGVSGGLGRAGEWLDLIALEGFSSPNHSLIPPHASPRAGLRR